MPFRNEKVTYSEITNREYISCTILLLLIALGLIVISIHDIVNAQAIIPSLMKLLAAASLLFFVGFVYRKKKKQKASNQIYQAQNNICMKELVSEGPSIQEDSLSGQNEIPLVAKVVFVIFLSMIVGAGSFVFAATCKSNGFSPAEILALLLIIGGLTVLSYFITLSKPIFSMKEINGIILLRRLTAKEQLVAIIAIISLCIGILLWVSN
jgi:hypothetical protein